MSKPLRNPAPDIAIQQIDDAIVRGVQAGDEHAFERLFYAYYPSLRRFAFSYTYSYAIAEDIVQDVMLSVWQRHAAFARNTSPSAYLYSAVRNRALDVLERDAVAQRHANAESVRTSSSVPLVDELLFANELERAAHEQVEALPDRIREVYRLRHDEGLESAEIAGVLGISVQAVYMRMSRALQALGERLKPWTD